MRTISLTITFLMVASQLWSQSRVLIVDDFISEFDWKELWVESFKTLGAECEVITVNETNAKRLSGADVVAWNCGNDTSGTLSADNRSALNEYLDSGGNLLVVSPGLPAEVFSSGDHSWLTSRLGCDYVMPNSLITWSSTYLNLPLEGNDRSILEGIRFDLTFGPKADVAADNLTHIHRTNDRATHLVPICRAI